MLRKPALWWLATLLWAAFIYYLTASPNYGGEQTEAVIVQAAPRAASAAAVEVGNIAIRKLAHLTVFSILGLLAYLALRLGPKPGRAALWAWLLATAYGGLDELHQSLVPGRHGTPLDVLIDSAGAALSIAILQVILRRIRTA